MVGWQSIDKKRLEVDYWRAKAVKKGLPSVIGYYAWHLFCGCQGGDDIISDVLRIKKKAEAKGGIHFTRYEQDLAIALLHTREDELYSQTYQSKEQRQTAYACSRVIKKLIDAKKAEGGKRA